MRVGEAAAIGVERQLAAGGDVAHYDEKAPASPRGTKTQIIEAVDRQIREGAAGHQMVNGRSAAPSWRRGLFC